MKLAGILLLLFGVLYPIIAMLWLNRWLRGGAGRAASQVRLVLVANGVVPICLILLGLGLLMPELWGLLTYRAALGMTALASCAVMAVILRGKWRRENP